LGPHSQVTGTELTVVINQINRWAIEHGPLNDAGIIVGDVSAAESGFHRNIVWQMMKGEVGHGCIELGNYPLYFRDITSRIPRAGNRRAGILFKLLDADQIKEI
jgi:hypothetical protein